MSPERSKEFTRGWKDYYAGKSRNEPPYSDAKRAAEWEKGYDAAVQAVRRVK